ncbi:hypothetical protein [Streptomyces sp. NPDC004008]
MGLEYLQDPSFWMVQLIFGAVLTFTRFPLELAHWLVRRSVRRAEQRVKAHAVAVDDEALFERFEDMVADHLEAPRLLRFFYAMVIVRESRRLTASDDQEPSPPEGGPGDDVLPPVTVSATTRQQRPESDDLGDGLVAAPSTAAPSSRRRTEVLVAAICAKLAVLSGRIVGGEYGSDYAAEMAQDLAGTRKLLVRVFYALSNLIGAVRLRLILRTIPFLQGLLAPAEGRRRLSLLAVIDYVVASDLICAGITAIADITTLLFVRGWLGLTFVTWIALPIALISAYGQARARRAWRAVRGAKEPA